MIDRDTDPQDSSWDLLKARLEEVHEFPCSYTFKFISPKDQVESLVELLGDHELKRRDSAGGRWVSVTAIVNVASSEEVMAIYRSVQSVEGLISL